MGNKSNSEKLDGVPIKVQVSDKDWMKMLQYCRLAKPNEIMGMARVREVQGGLEIYDPFIMKQKVGPATCEFDRADFARFMATCEDIEMIKCVWHSHVEMSAFFSSCDRATSEGMAALGRTMGGASSWFLSLVMNCRQEHEAKVDIFRPSKMVLPCEVSTYEKEETNPEMLAEVRTKVEAESYTSNKRKHDHDHSHGSEGFHIVDFDNMSQRELDEIMNRNTGHRGQPGYYGSEGQIWTPPKREIKESPAHEAIFGVIGEHLKNVQHEKGGGK